METIPAEGEQETVDRINQDRLYAEANAALCEVIRRLAKGYELDPELRRDLLQDMHIELWASLKLFDERCSLRTWVYRIAHNVGASHVLKSKRSVAKLVGLESIEVAQTLVEGEAEANRRFSINRLLTMIRRLKPLDRQVMLLYLEGETAGSIADVTGLSAENVATKVHRIRTLLKKQYFEGAAHAGVREAK